MIKFFINLNYLVKIGSSFTIILNFIKNFFINYKTKKKSKNIENKLYIDFHSKYKHGWFFTHLYFLNKNLSSLKNVKKILEIGSYEGASAIFFANLFNNTTIDCVDTWSGGEQQPGENFSYIENNFNKNTKFLSSRLNKYKMFSDQFFLNKKSSKYDLIFIDGDHEYDQVYRDANNAWERLNNSGVLIFDDYTYNHYTNNIFRNPAAAINKFLSERSNEIKKFIIWKQVIIFKK